MFLSHGPGGFRRDQSLRRLHEGTLNSDRTTVEPLRAKHSTKPRRKVQAVERE